MRLFHALLRPTYAQKLSLLMTLPLIVAGTAIAVLVGYQSRSLAEREIQALEMQLLEAKKAELRNYVTQARNGFAHIYGLAAPDDAAAKEQVTQILSAMIYGKDGFFFVYDYDGTNLVSPRQTEYINRNWAGLTDSAGVPVVDEFIRLARDGAGWHSFTWEKPSTGEEAQMIAYVLGLQDWQWAIGTGVFNRRCAGHGGRLAGGGGGAGAAHIPVYRGDHADVAGAGLCLRHVPEHTRAAAGGCQAEGADPAGVRRPGGRARPGGAGAA